MSSYGEKGGSLATVTFADLIQAGPWAFVQMSPEVWLMTLHFTPLSPSDQGYCLYLPFSTFALWQMSWPSAWFLSIGQKELQSSSVIPQKLTEVQSAMIQILFLLHPAMLCHHFYSVAVHVGMDGRLHPAR